MDYVVFEAGFTPPIATEAYPDTYNSHSWCFDVRGAVHRRAHVALDGHKTVCIFRAPDVEAVRSAARLGGIDFERTFAATFHAPSPGTAAPRPEHGSEVHVVERAFPEPVPFADIQAIEDRGAWCLEAHRVRFAYTYFSLDRKRMLCMYEAPDAESVRRAQTRAGVPFDRVWPARLFLEPDEKP